MVTKKPTLLMDGLVFPEGPRWHEGRLWVSDQHAHRVHTLSMDGTSEVVAEFDDMPSGLGFLPGGELLAACMRTQRIFKVAGDTVELHADLSDIRPGWINDMVVDEHGRAYVGQRQGHYGQGTDKKEALVLVEPDGSHRVVADDLIGPNGSVVTPDGGTLILAETRGQRLSAFTIKEDGSLSDRRTFASFDTRRPDGICLDDEGAVWIGSPLTGEFLRVKEGGEVLDRISTKDDWAVACVLGGADRRTLFMLVTETTRENLGNLRNAESDAKSQSKGRIEMLEVDVAGVGWP